MSLPLRYAAGGVALAIVLNLLLRTFVKVGGIFATLIVAAAVAGTMALWFGLAHHRAPTAGERWRIVVYFAGLLGVLYLGLLGMMALQDTPSPMGVALFVLHYLCYPVLVAVMLSDHLFGKRR